jgi:hypothetical protein
MSLDLFQALTLRKLEQRDCALADTDETIFEFLTVC